MPLLRAELVQFISFEPVRVLYQENFEVNHCTLV